MLRFVKFWQGVGVMAEQYPERRTYECLKFAIWNTAQGWRSSKYFTNRNLCLKHEGSMRRNQRKAHPPSYYSETLKRWKRSGGQDICSHQVYYWESLVRSGKTSGQ